MLQSSIVTRKSRLVTFAIICLLVIAWPLIRELIYDRIGHLLFFDASFIESQYGEELFHYMETAPSAPQAKFMAAYADHFDWPSDTKAVRELSPAQRQELLDFLRDPTSYGSQGIIRVNGPEASPPCPCVYTPWVMIRCSDGSRKMAVVFTEEMNLWLEFMGAEYHDHMYRNRDKLRRMVETWKLPIATSGDSAIAQQRR